MSFSLTDSASKRISTLLAKDGRSDAFFRIGVNGGGCQGFEYQFDIDTNKNDDDQDFSKGNASVFIDRTSLVYLMGSQLNWLETLSEEKFEITNPNATSSCGCGVSFSI